LLLFGPVFDSEAVLSDIIKSHWPAILITGGLLVGLAKIIWYEGFRRLDISKTISLGMTFPLFSLIFILLFTNEMISLYQWIGIMIMLIGVYFSIKRKSVEPTLTKYAPIE
jgi:drug/metabolite transporter (DMT)-like permease